MKKIIILLGLYFLYMPTNIAQKILITKNGQEFEMNDFDIKRGILTFTNNSSPNSVSFPVDSVYAYYDIDEDTQELILSPSAIIFGSGLLGVTVFNTDLENQQLTFKRKIEAGTINLYHEEKATVQYFYLEKDGEFSLIYQFQPGVGSILSNDMRSRQIEIISNYSNNDSITMSKLVKTDGLINHKEIRPIINDYNVRHHVYQQDTTTSMSKLKIIRLNRKFEGSIKLDVNEQQYVFEEGNYATIEIPVNKVSLIKLSNHVRTDYVFVVGSKYTDQYIKLYQRDENKIRIAYSSIGEFNKLIKKRNSMEIKSRNDI